MFSNVTNLMAFISEPLQPEELTPSEKQLLKHLWKMREHLQEYEHFNSRLATDIKRVTQLSRVLQSEKIGLQLWLAPSKPEHMKKLFNLVYTAPHAESHELDAIKAKSAQAKLTNRHLPALQLVYDRVDLDTYILDGAAKTIGNQMIAAQNRFKQRVDGKSPEAKELLERLFTLESKLKSMIANKADLEARRKAS
ncbi:MAG TPA: hypothetical protein V6C72_15520 [Chroococcales cyanobacterium]